MAENVECKVFLSKLTRKIVSSVSYKLSVPDFYDLLKHYGTDFESRSSSFEFANATWQFRIEVGKSHLARKEPLLINVFLVRVYCKIPTHRILSQIIILDDDDNECTIFGYHDNIEDDHNETYLCYLESEKVSNSRRDTASVIIHLFHIESTEEESDQASVPTIKDVEGLSQDFKKLLLNGKNYDLTLRVADKEFRVHRDVLMARCPVFESMLNHDMTEKKEGIINVPDCDLLAMEEFLLFVYCGKVESLNQDNMLGLYYAADKYQMLILKEECSKFIKESLSPSIICDVVQLALNHSDTDLLECATKYFVNHTK